MRGVELVTPGSVAQREQYRATTLPERGHLTGVYRQATLLGLVLDLHGLADCTECGPPHDRDKEESEADFHVWNGQVERVQALPLGQVRLVASDESPFLSEPQCATVK